jgi:hypothetical protein
MFSFVKGGSAAERPTIHARPILVPLIHAALMSPFDIYAQMQVDSMFHAKLDP